MGDTTHAGRLPVPYTTEDREADAMAQRELDRIREAQAVEPRVLVERVAVEALREALREALALRTAEVASLQAQVNELSRHVFGRADAPVAVVDDGWRPETQIVFVNGCRCRVEQRHDGWRWNVQMGNGWETNLAPTEAEAKAAALAAAKGM